MTKVLLLNADYTPMRILAWQKAVGLVLEEKVGVVAAYEDRQIRSQSLSLPWPAVVALRRYARHRGRISFNRMHVIARDEASCQYCGVRPRTHTGRLELEALTLDHVVPRVQAVEGVVRLPWNGRRAPVNSWENVVASCSSCNASKGGRTPEEAGMTLLRVPRRPTSRELLRAAFARARIPEEWQPYVPEDVRALSA